MVNRVILIGNLGRDPEMRRLENGVTVAKFPIATNENYRDKNGEWQTLTEWHDIVVWRSLADRAEAQLKKGMPVYIEGKLTHRTWQDQDGNNRKTTEVVASYFRALTSRREGAEGGSAYFPGADDEYPVNSGMATAAKNSPPISEMPTEPAPETPEDDLPF